MAMHERRSPAERLLEPGEFEEGFQNYVASLADLHAAALSNISKAQDRQVSQHARRKLHGDVIICEQVPIGSYVYYSEPAQGKKRKFSGPPVIMRVKQANSLGSTFTLEDSKGKTVVAHVSHLVPYKPP